MNINEGKVWHESSFPHQYSYTAIALACYLVNHTIIDLSHH